MRQQVNWPERRSPITVFMLLWWYNNMKFLLGFILLPALIYGFQTPFRPFYWARSIDRGMFHHHHPLATPPHMVSPQMRTPHIPMGNYRTPQFLMPTIKPSNSMSYRPYTFNRMIVSKYYLFKIAFWFTSLKCTFGSLQQSMDPLNYLQAKLEEVVHRESRQQSAILAETYLSMSEYEMQCMQRSFCEVAVTTKTGLKDDDISRAALSAIK